MTLKKYGLLILLCIGMLISLCACDTAGDGGAAADADADTPVTPIYVIVRADDGNNEEKAGAVRLRMELEALTGAEVELTTDWVQRGEDIEAHRFANEIVFGDTNRAESVSAYAALNAGTRDMIDYTITSNDKHYVIAATAGNVDDAVTQFLSHFTDNLSLLAEDPIEINDSRKHVFPLDDIQFAGVSVANYGAIVYRDGYCQQTVNDIASISDLIFEGCGYRLPVQSDAKAFPNGGVIRFGAREDAAVLAAGKFSYSVTIDETGVRIDGRDEYCDTRGIDHFKALLSEGIAAGGTLSINADDGIRVENTDKEEIMRAAWVIGAPNMDKEEQFAEIKDCGFNMIILQRPNDADLFYQYCKWMAKYELPGLWSDHSAHVPRPDEGGTEPGASYIKIDPDGYMNTDITWGNMLRDEPSSAMFEQLRDASRAYEAIANDDKVAYINLFPSYATEEQLGNPTYEAHLKEYFDTVQPLYGSVDIYPLNVAQNINADYFYNLDVFSTECRTRGIPFSVYIQSVSFNQSKRTPNEREMRWQAYCCLSFGAENIEYFTYRTPISGAETYKDALIGADDTKTENWYGAQAVNRDLAAISEAYMQYNNLGAFTVNPVSDASGDFMRFSNQYTAFDAIERVTVSRDKPVLIGAFSSETAEHDRAFTCVNLGDPGYQITPIDVTVDLTDAKTATLYYKGETTTLTPDENGCITFTLEYGDGCFVTLGR